MEGGFELHLERRSASPDGGQKLFGRLNQAFRPAGLLGLEGIHLHRKLRGALDGRVVHKLPATQLRAVGEVCVLGERVVLPAAGVGDGRAPPHPGRAVEVEEAPGKIPPAVLDNEVSVEQNRFHFGQVRKVPVDPRPSPLDHRHLGIGEIGDEPLQGAGRGNEVGVEDGDEFTARLLKPRGERPGLVALAIRAAVIGDGNARRRQAFDQPRGYLARLVRRIVQHLNLQPVAWVIELRRRFEQPLDHVALVGQLHRHPREFFKAARWPRRVALVADINPGQGVTVQAVNRKDDEDGKVRNQNRKVESIRMVETAKGIFLEYAGDVPDEWVRRKHQADQKKGIHLD